MNEVLPMSLGEFHFHPSFNWETEVQRNEGNRLKDDSVWVSSPTRKPGLRLLTSWFSLQIWRVHSLPLRIGLWQQFSSLETQLSRREGTGIRLLLGRGEVTRHQAHRSTETEISSKMRLSPSFAWKTNLRWCPDSLSLEEGPPCSPF